MRAAFLEMNPYFRDQPSASIEVTLDFPHGEYLMVGLSGLPGGADLAEAARNLRVRGGR